MIDDPPPLTCSCQQESGGISRGEVLGSKKELLLKAVYRCWKAVPSFRFKRGMQCLFVNVNSESDTHASHMP